MGFGSAGVRTPFQRVVVDLKREERSIYLSIYLYRVFSS